MTAVAVERACAGCGGPLEPNKGRGRPRQWCSDRCAKRQYAGSCEVCGEPTNASGSSGTRGSNRCRLHSKRIETERRRRAEAAMEMLRLRRDFDMDNDEIARRVDRALQTVAQELHRLRALGFDVPYGKYARARAGGCARALSAGLDAEGLAEALRFCGIDIPGGPR